MIGPAMDRGGLKDSETAPNSFFPKINRTVFRHLGTDMIWLIETIPTIPHNPCDFQVSSPLLWPKAYPGLS